MSRSFDEAMMERALELAVTARGWTSPNPVVGAVVVKDGRIIGEGCHERFGEAHAERNALAACRRGGADPKGATLYVTLEPCCHTGHQPPCTEAVIAAGVARVVVGSADPNPLVAGKGCAILRNAGIEVEEGVLRDRCDAENRVFFHYITEKTPFIVAKWAMTLDGRISTKTGDARWVSNELSRRDAHRLRHELASVVVGIGTVLADDPLLTCRRDAPSRQPLRIVCDSRLSIPETCKLVATAHEFPLIVATTEKAITEHGEKAGRLRDKGAEILKVDDDDTGRVSLPALMRELGAREIDSALLEGGAGLLGSAFDAGLVNRAVVYVAPKVVGGTKATPPVGGTGVRLMTDALHLGSPSVTTFRDDVRLTYEIETARPLGAEDDETHGERATASAGERPSGRRNGEPFAGGVPTRSPLKDDSRTANAQQRSVDRNEKGAN